MGARCLIFSRILCLLPYFMCANSEGFGETAWMRWLAGAFTGRLCDKYHNLMSWLKLLQKSNSSLLMKQISSHQIMWHLAKQKIDCWDINRFAFEPAHWKKVVLSKRQTAQPLLFQHIRYEPPCDKTNKMTVHPAKTQISLGIHPVWSVFAVRSVGS